MQEVNKVNIFNILKSIAMICVFGVHSLICIRDIYPDTNFPWFFYTPAWASMWIFFLLSGYLLGKGFYNNKYSIDKKGIFVFWINRFIRIAPPYFIFVFIIFLFAYPELFAKEHFYQFVPLLTFTYNIKPIVGNTQLGIGYLWFISTIIQFYILAPFVYKYVLSKIKINKFFALFLIMLFGFIVKIIVNAFHPDYFYCVLQNPLTNLDIFFGGMFLNSITKDSADSKLKQYLRPISIIVLLLTLVYQTYELSFHWRWFYNYVGPTIYTSLTMLVIYSFDYKKSEKQSPLTIGVIKKNPLRIFDAYGTIVLGFYLYHSYILCTLVKMYKVIGGGIRHSY